MKKLYIPVGKMQAVFLSAVLFFAMALNVACAVESKSAMSNSTLLTQTYTWYDGDREQQVWLNPQVVAEFNPSSQGESSIMSADAAAKIMPTKHKRIAVRIWKLRDTTENTIRNLNSIYPQGKYSAVLHDGPSSSGRMRALPGNIIIYLDPQWDEATVSTWLSAHKLEIVKKLEIGPNIYVIKTDPGMKALETANSLYLSGEVKAAFPDWWQEVSTR
jgi:hypothetical protein